MRIKSFTIRDFKNIKYAQCNDVPDFLVICGSNGSGKSSILEAIMAVKRRAGGVNSLQIYKNYVSGYAQSCQVEIFFEFTDLEIERTNTILAPHLKVTGKKLFRVKMIIAKNGNSTMEYDHDNFVSNVLNVRGDKSSFFDYFSAHRQNTRSDVASWNPGSLNSDSLSKMLDNGENKYNLVKTYLAALKMGDLQNIQRSQMAGEVKDFDSLKDIRDFFNQFFTPMRFSDVYIDRSPFYFEIETPAGAIDINDLSSGEKEILNTYVHFHQLACRDSILLMDEPDVHLHPELQRRFLKILRKIGQGNQLFITTHSPEMMSEAGQKSLFTVIKYPTTADENQFVMVSGDEDLHEALSDVMGATGFVSLNRKIVFIEGESASTDLEFYRTLFPGDRYNMSFIPAGDSTMVKAVSDKVFYLLEQGDGFQQFYCIIDGDIENRHSNTGRLFKLPVYHVENYLLDEANILKISQMLLSQSFPLKDADEVSSVLKDIVLGDAHIKSYTRSLLDSQVFGQAELAKNLIFQNRFGELQQIQKIEYDTLMTQSLEIMQNAMGDNTWKGLCKGRDVLKEYCRINKLKYDQFRNALIFNFDKPPAGLQTIVNTIMAT